MSLLSRLLASLPGAGGSAGVARSKPTDRYIEGAINQALTQAGLLKGVKKSSALDPRLPTSPRLTGSSSQKRKVLAGEFGGGQTRTDAGALSYRLFVPTASDHSARPLGLIVMLHGCTQSPDDFAVGTRMNQWGQAEHCMVVYPAQSTNANGSKCWNWFRSGDQDRGQGEPALLAAMTRELITHYGVDTTRVYVAGLSAGAAMAVILGHTYPDLFVAVGSHSGLPYRAASDAASAFSAMSGKCQTAAGIKTSDREGIVPLIIFHGDADHTVSPANGRALLEQTLGPASHMRPESEFTDLAAGYTRITYTTALDAPFVEYWSLKGLGHSWSGGDSSGSFTDHRGPDASEEMIRFFREASCAIQANA